MSAAQNTDDAAHVTRRNEAEAQERLAAAAKLVRQPGLNSFFETLYRGAAPDDVNRYTPEALAALARMVFARFGKHQAGACEVSLFCARDEDKAYGENDSILVAINDDKPFLFDSLIADVSAQGGRLRAVFHPIVQKEGHAVSVIVLALEPILSDAKQAALTHSAKRTFAQVDVAVRDWRGMMARLKDAIAELKAHPPKVAADE